MSKFRRILLIISAFGLPLFLSGCQLALLDPKGMIAIGEKNIMVTSAMLMLVIVIPVIILTFAFAFRYREGNTRAVYSPNWSHSTSLEIIWWSIPCVIVFILGSITWTSSHQLDPYKPIIINDSKPITIEAIALEWKWLFIYPEQNIATVNFLEIPTGVPIRFLITAEGPMNSFQIPQLAGQIYAMAGMQTKLHLVANSPGDYQGLSANFSGDGFSDMKFTVRATTQNEFNQWVTLAKQSTRALTMLTYNELVKPSAKNPVTYYSSANKDLFETVVMKAMMPMPMTDKAFASEDKKVVVSSKK